MIQLPLALFVWFIITGGLHWVFMAKEKDIILPNDKLMLSGDLSELQFVMLHYPE